MKLALALRHLAFEDLGTLGPWLTDRDYEIRYHDVGVDDLRRVDPVAADLVIVLGGPIGAGDDRDYPYLAEETAFIRQRLDSNKPLLGICLGAQLMARALGADVAPMGVKEIGFSTLEITGAGNNSPLRHLAGAPVLHWHGDRFALPVGAPSLASTAVCDNQAFMPGPHALALQFHVEADVARFETWLIGHATELSQANVDIPALRRAARENGPKLPGALDAMMSEWLQQAQA